MPRSRLVSDIRYGESGYFAFNPYSNMRSGGVTAKFVDHFIDGPLAVRMEVNARGLAIYAFLDARPSRIDL